MRPAFLLVIATFTLAGQIGQYPPGTYPPGQYPGRYPSGGSPGGGPGVPGRGSRRTTTREEKQPAAQSQSVSGMVRKLDADSFELEAEDTRFLIIQFSASVPKPANLRVGDGVDVVATMNADGMFYLVSVKPNKDIAQTIEERDRIEIEPEGRTGPPPTILVRPDTASDANDPGPPKLKRGKPVERASTGIPEDAPGAASQKNPAISRGNPHLNLIDKAREVAATFLEGLPNYICQEQTTRYYSETRQPSWNVIDIVSAEVVYDDHQESYRNLQINGKPTKKSPEESGAWSTGEFGTILANLFAPQSEADFKYVQDDTIDHRAASVFDFKVQRVRSNWRIWVPGQYILPTYRGSVWIDKQSAQVLRIEMQAKEIPEAFPEITVETAVDYQAISLGTPDKFLLPVHSEALSCWRSSNQCQRNVIEFRNYHKFSGESIIKFNQ
jgi:hypothetical protein